MGKSGSSDTHVDIFVWCLGGVAYEHMWRSSTKSQTLSPAWNERVGARRANDSAECRTCLA